jgi:hypothetical protein
MTILGNGGKFDWAALWGDLLKGAGRGLLTYDGSRAAQAALAGLDHFEAAQDRRRLPSQPRERLHDDPVQKLRSILSPEQLTALFRLPLEDQIAWAEENAESQSDRMPQPLGTLNPQGQSGQPMPIHPLSGWHLQSVLPFGSDGRLNLPTYRR